jgi:REP element-mobilizing transposase RayT
MARQARGESIDPNKIQMVHVFNRCVRRAFLCGQDIVTGRDFEHRRQWARDRLEHLASVFAIDCVTFSIMSNHTHQILRSRPDIAATWDDQTVAMRWLKLTPKRTASGKQRDPTEYEINQLVNDPELLGQIRVRLSDVSWWMRYFAQNIAYRANREDDVTGHFWEGRFGSELIESDASILACMVYVDLNPVRAAMAQTPEESDFTGAKERIDDLRIELATGDDGAASLTLRSSEMCTMSVHDWERLDNEHCGWLCPIEIDEATDAIGPDADQVGRRASRKGVFAISLTRYLELLDWVGRQVRGDKRGAIPAGLGAILKRIGLSTAGLLSYISMPTTGKSNSANADSLGNKKLWPVPG